MVEEQAKANCSSGAMPIGATKQNMFPPSSSFAWCRHPVGRDSSSLFPCWLVLNYSREIRSAGRPTRALKRSTGFVLGG